MVTLKQIIFIVKSMINVSGLIYVLIFTAFL